MNDIGAVLSVLCGGPVVFIAIGFWAGKGFPGWPWKITKRHAAQYYEEEY